MFQLCEALSAPGLMSSFGKGPQFHVEPVIYTYKYHSNWKYHQVARSTRAESVNMLFCPPSTPSSETDLQLSPSPAMCTSCPCRWTSDTSLQFKLSLLSAPSNCLTLWLPALPSASFCLCTCHTSLTIGSRGSSHVCHRDPRPCHSQRVLISTYLISTSNVRVSQAAPGPGLLVLLLKFFHCQ